MKFTLNQAVVKALHQRGRSQIPPFMSETMTDARCGCRSDLGLDIPSLQQFKASTRSLQAVYCEGTVCNLVDGHDTITNDELSTLGVDILIPAALES